MHVLVTGGAGFIGSHFVRHLLEAYPAIRVTNLDSLTYAAHPDTVDYLARLSPNRYEFVRCDITSPKFGEVLAAARPDVVVNFAAESHVDRSILDPGAFVQTNIVGVQNVMNHIRALGKIRFVHVSTDEVYGTLLPEEAAFTEGSNLVPNSPYAASKAGADLLVLAGARTFGMDAVITRCTNNYGPFQFPEKLIPLVIANAIEDRPIPVYGDGRQVRDWIYVQDHCRAIAAVMDEGLSGEVYNVSSEQEQFNIDIIHKILGLLGKPQSLITHVGDRPAHDRRYALNAAKIGRELEWKSTVGLEEGLKKTVEWYLQNKEWWQKVRNKDYFAYYQANYTDKFEKGEVQ